MRSSTRGGYPPGLKIFGEGARMRADGISMMSNYATFEAGMAKANCGAQMMGAGANLIATDAQVIVGVAGMLPSVGRIAAEGGALRSFATAEPKHHVFPQQFRGEFEKMGIDIDRFTLQMPQGVHNDLHAMGWNADWEEFLAEGLPRPRRTTLLRT